MVVVVLVALKKSHMENVIAGNLPLPPPIAPPIPLNQVTVTIHREIYPASLLVIGSHDGKEGQPSSEPDPY